MRLFLNIIVGASLIVFQGCVHTKPLVESATIGDISAVERALKNGADVNAKGQYGNTALHDASFSGNVTIVRILLEYGADTNERGRGGLTALHYATSGANKGIARILLDNGAKINAKSDSGYTALHFATTSIHEKITQFLLDNGSDVHARDELGQTALHKAASGGSPGVVLTLIGAGSKIDIEDNDGNTPLMIAQKSNNSNVALILENEYLVQGKAGQIGISNVDKMRKLSAEKINADGIAIIIGIQKYNHKDIPEVKFAKNDAEAMREFITQVLGYQDGNIILMIDPTKADLEMIFGIKGNHMGILYDYIKPDISEVFIYYSGHGAPDVSTNKAYLVPKNGNPSKIAFTGYPLETFYENISKLSFKKMTIVIDACFSGGTDSGKWIVSNASPALINISNPAAVMKNVAIMTSSESSQISSWYPDKEHGLFTYFFLKAAHGEADKDGNNMISYQELFNYVSDRAEGVPYWARRLHGGRIQTSTMQLMNEHDIFISY